MAYLDDDYENSVILLGLLMYLDNVTSGEREDLGPDDPDQRLRLGTDSWTEI